MPGKPTRYELSAERTIPGVHGNPPTLLRLTAEFAVPPSGGGPSDFELQEAARTLQERLDRIVPVESPGEEPSDRSLDELLHAYRPRQKELVDLLREEGTISQREQELLRSYFDEVPSHAPARVDRPGPAAEPGVPSRAGPPTAGSPARPVEELLRLYGIESVKQAGAVRARRQISFDEYMALKEHFARDEPRQEKPPG